MKLLYKYSRINLITSVIIFLFASIAFYFSVHFVLIKQVDEDLKLEQHEIEVNVERTGKLPEIIPLKDEITSYEPATAFSKERHINTVKIADMTDDKEEELFRQLS